MSVEALQVLIEVATSGVEKVKALKDNIAGISKLNSKLKNVGETIDSVGKRMNMDLTAPIMVGLVAATKVGVEFESAMADVVKVTGIAPAKVAEMASSIRKLSLELPVSAKGLAEITAAGGQLGIQTQNLEAFTRGAATMGTAFEIAASDAGESMADLKNVLGLSIDEVISLGDAMNHLSNKSNATAKDIVSATVSVGGVGKTFGLAAEETAALTAAFVGLGAEPEVAATAIASILPKLRGATGQTASFKEGLKAIGLSAQQMQDAVENDASGALVTFISHLEKLDGIQRTLAIQKMTGEGEDSRLLSVLANDVTQLSNAFDLVGDKALFAGSMIEEANVKAGTRASQFIIAKNNMADLAITVDSILKPAMASSLTTIANFIAKLNTFAQAHPGIAKIAVALGLILAVAGPILIAIGAVVSAVGTIIPVVAATIAFITGIVATILPFLSMIAAVVGVTMTTIVGFFGSPVIAVVALAAAFAAAAALIITNWSRVKAFFASLVSNFAGAMRGMAATAQSGVSRIIAVFNSLVTRASAAISNLASRMFESGASIMARLAAGIISGMGPVGAAISGVGTLIAANLPGSPVKSGPLVHTLNPTRNAGYKISERIGQGISRGSQEVTGQLNALISPQLGATIPSTSPSGGGGGSFSPVINITVDGASGNGDEIATSIEDRFMEMLPRLMEQYKAEQMRVSYG